MLPDHPDAAEEPLNQPASAPESPDASPLITELPPRAWYHPHASDATAFTPQRVLLPFRSRSLARTVQIEIFLPPAAVGAASTGPVLYLNDGQDADALDLSGTLEKLWAAQELPPLTIVAMHANRDRLQEYGVASSPDFRGRGARAAAHARFVTEELMPYITATYRPLPGAAHCAYAGFSLGGLSALDTVWEHPELFSAAGVFSGSLWWRSRAVTDPLYSDATDRIMLRRIAETPARPGLRFWFEVGTEDEKNDRNNNGVIDAIDDTVDLMKLLLAKGYPDADLRYLEIAGGRHHQTTWAEALPDFLRWTFGS